MTITSEQRDTFARDGFLVLPGFYDVEREVTPIREGARRIIEALAAEHGVDAPCDTAEQAMGPGLMALSNANRAFAGEVYDAVKQIPGFMQLVSDRRNSTVFEALREGSSAGLAAGGYGIRIDLPAEDKYRALWHQEFPAQLRSPDGIVFWSPLVEITPELGPVQIGAGSHLGGVAPVYNDDGGIGKTGAYALRLANEEALLAKYPAIAPLSKPGDLILMDFLTLHQSGVNRSTGPRWSMQFRYFNFEHPVGRKIAWKGSFAAGVDFASVMPELVAGGDQG